MRTTIERGWGEREVEVSRVQLIQTLKDNRKKHRKEYQEALAGYKVVAKDKVRNIYNKASKALGETCTQILDRIEAGDPDNPLGEVIVLSQAVSFKLPVPEDHTKDYDIALQMAEWEVNETITLTQSQFQCFVLDDWEWQEEFANTSRLYSN